MSLVLGCDFFFFGDMCPVAWVFWDLALSLSLTFAMVLLFTGAASPSLFWMVLFVASLPLRVLLPLPLGRAVVVGFWGRLGN